ncbi:MAG: TonB-dependent receptor, partial [Sphingomonadaceae bacterium]|nr:TonB-dependent receptor [Sphingomonadaceae bacterium]
APKAQLYGAELDLQYNVDLYSLGSWFETKQLVLVGNYTYTSSKIKVGATDTTSVFPGGVRPATDFFIDGVPLTGQSDHLINAQLSLEDKDRLQQVTVLFSFGSKRVTSRGTSGLPDIVEDPGLTVDIVGRQGLTLFGREFELKAEARNIFGRDHYEYQSNGTNRVEINSYRMGQSFSFSISAEF